MCGIAGRCHLSSRSAPLAQAGWVPAVAAGTAAAAGRRLFSSDPSGLPHDKILLRGLVFHGYHGVLPEVGAGAVGYNTCVPRCNPTARLRLHPTS